MTIQTFARRARVRAAGFAGSTIRIAAALLLAALAACSDSTGPGGQADASRIDITYSGSGPDGVLQGTYAAQGDPRLGSDPIGQTYAVGQRAVELGVIEVVSGRRHGNEVDVAFVTIPLLQVGTVQIDRDCDADACAAVLLALDMGLAQGSQARYSCVLHTGTVRITALTDERVRGDFTGTGACFGREEGEQIEDFSISAGTFDVKLMDVDI
jgi:hypothetical protein